MDTLKHYVRVVDGKIVPGYLISVPARTSKLSRAQGFVEVVLDCCQENTDLSVLTNCPIPEPPTQG